MNLIDSTSGVPDLYIYRRDWDWYLSKVACCSRLNKRDTSSQAKSVHMSSCLQIIQPIQHNTEFPEEVYSILLLLDVRLQMQTRFCAFDLIWNRSVKCNFSASLCPIGIIFGGQNKFISCTGCAIFPISWESLLHCIICLVQAVRWRFKDLDFDDEIEEFFPKAKILWFEKQRLSSMNWVNIALNASKRTLGLSWRLKSSSDSTTWFHDEYLKN